jgi:phosphomannomutase
MGIFRSYDIRGVYGRDVNEDIMERIGAAFARVSTKTIAIGNDGRTSSISLKKAFIGGCGKEVLDVGTVPLGAGMMFVLNKSDFAYVTASHLGKEWNGVKFFHKNGVGFMDDENKRIEKIFAAVKAEGRPGVRKAGEKDVLNYYIDYVAKKIKLERKIDVVLDCGNGMASGFALPLFKKVGFNAASIYDKVDGNFPNRGPDPAEDPLNELKKKVLSADIGVAYDGDGDRQVLVDETGRKLTPEQTSYLILLEAVKFPGQIVANVECTRLIDDIARKFGKKVIRVPVGHTFLMEAVLREKACFGVEVSGHYALPFMAPVDDSLMVSVFAAYVLSRQQKKLSEIVDEIKVYPFERLSVECDDDKKFNVVASLKSRFKKQYKNVNTMDGVRVDFPDGWILIRPSNTAPIIRLSIEANDRRSLEKLKKEFLPLLKEAAA